MRKNGKSNLLNQILKASDFLVYQMPETLMGRPVFGMYGTGMWFVVKVINEVSCRAVYLRNDGQLFEVMQTHGKDLNGGTYHPTKEDAEASLNRYLQGQNNG